ncbi:MAG: uroporphyrinogen decarboxylase [Planctomycetota bacterium]|nr:uroporphyrinogen decarboxylase [Planctomycetota bacterium]
MSPLFTRAVRGEPVERYPVWMMRQAGRYLPGYMAVRSKTPFLELCRSPDLAAQVSLEPIERFDMDAAIVFADILLTADAMGVPVEFPAHGGPSFPHPIRTPADVERVHEPDAARTRCVADTIRILRSTLPETKAVIGFSAAPFTLCAYMIEGGSSRDFIHTRRFAHEHPDAFEELMQVSADALIPYLQEQIAAGADVLQLFDTWGAVLPPALYRRWVIPMTQHVIEGLGRGRPPVIYFPGIGSEARLEQAVETGAEALSLDWQTDLAAAYARVGNEVRLQGNLDPSLLLTTPKLIRAATTAMLKAVPAGHAHLANLGHGIHKDTPPENAAAFIETVQAFRPAAGALA